MRKLFAVLVLVVTPLLMGASYLAFKQTINVSCTPSRTTGVAPLYVHYDCTATTASSLTSQPFHDIQYTFDYGDTAAPTAAWGYGVRTGSGSKNTDYGAPVGSHIYETAGTYTATVTAYYNGTSVSINVSSVTVADADAQWTGAKTICITNGSDFTGCPGGATQVPSTSTYVRTYSADTRVLFRRGDSFTGSSGGAAISNAGPGMVGAYGSGSKPVLTAHATAFDGAFSFAYGNSSDWRFVDLDIRRSVASNRAFVGTATTTKSKHTLLRIDTDAGILLELDSTTQPSEIAIHDCVASQVDIEATYIWANKLSVRGNSFAGATASGIVNVARFMGITTAVISNNTWPAHTTSGQTGGSALTIRTHEIPASDPQPGKIVIADNAIDAGMNFYGVSIFPCGVGLGHGCETDPLITDVVIERNYVTCNTNTCGVALDLESTVNPTMRNNILRLGGTGLGVGAGIQVRKGNFSNFNGSGAALYNNSFYVNSSQGSISVISLQANTSGAVVRNNLGYAPNATSPVMVADSASGTTTCATCNTDNTQLKNTAPTGWTIPATQASHFAITGGYAVDGGVAVPVWSDYNAATRTGTYDLGALNP